MPPTTDPASQSADRTRFLTLAGLLGRECDLIDRLVFKLAEAELLATAGEARFMGFMVDEIDEITEELGSIELARGLLVSDIAHQAGLDSDDVPLSRIVELAPREVDEPLRHVRRRLSAATEELSMATIRGRATIDARLDELRMVLDRIEPAVVNRQGYNRWGGGVAGVSASPTRFNHSA